MFRIPFSQHFLFWAGFYSEDFTKWEQWEIQVNAGSPCHFILGTWTCKFGYSSALLCLFLLFLLSFFPLCLSSHVSSWISSVVLPHSEHRDHVRHFLSHTLSSFLLHPSFYKLSLPSIFFKIFSLCLPPLSSFSASLLSLYSYVRLEGVLSGGFLLFWNLSR